MSRRGSLLATTLLAAAALLGGASDRALAQTAQWTDTTGESGFAPDLETILGDLSNPQTISVAMSFRQARLYGGDALLVYIDSDLNPATGAGGLDYRLSLRRLLDGTDDQLFTRWNGSGWEYEPSGGAMAWHDQGGTAAVAVTRARIGATGAGVNLVVASNRVNQGTFSYTDLAPDSGQYLLRPPGSPQSGGAIQPDLVEPDLVLGLSRSVFRAASSGPAFASARAAVGSRLSFKVSEAGKVTFTVQRANRGRRVRGRCVKPTRSNRGRRRCTRWVRVRGSFAANGLAGPNAITFRGRIGGRKLGPGRYRLSGRAADAAGNASAMELRSFRIVR